MISFDEKTHTYTNEKGVNLVSTTTLLRWAGISPNYEFVNEEVLKAAADKGTLIHKEIEDYIKKGEVGFTDELQQFINYIEVNHYTILASEKVVYNDEVAGTIDLIIKTPTGRIIYVDFKTTSTIHTNSVSWQLSIYKDLDLNFEKDDFDSFLNADLQVWHFSKKGLVVKDLPEVSTDLLEKLYESYINNTKFEVTLKEQQLQQLYEVEKVIAYYENQKKEAERNAELIREQIIAAMKEQGATKFENDRIVISYIPQTTMETFDAKTFKEENPDVYKKYLKHTKRKAQVRIKLKGEDNE